MSDSYPLSYVTAHLAAIVQSSDDIIVSKTLDGVIESWNPAAERILGYTAAEAIGKHIRLIVPPDRWAEEEGVLARIRRGERVEHFETVRRAKDGRLLNFSLTVSPVRDQRGTIVGASKDRPRHHRTQACGRRARTSAGFGERSAPAGRGSQPTQGRISGRRVARASHAAERDYWLGIVAADAKAGRSDGARD